jgi:rod shape-determining protein MreC
MRKTITYPFIGFGLFLFLLLNLPRGVYDRIRAVAISPFYRPFIMQEGCDAARLQLENQHLRAQLEHAYEWLLSDVRMTEQLELLKEMDKKAEFVERAKQLRELLRMQMAATAAQVVYRDPSSWSSSVWVNVGEDRKITKNSPVLADGALVGVIDYVGKKQSRIRLITDSALIPSVRVSRGLLQNRELAHQLQALGSLIEKREDLFATTADKEQFSRELRQLKEKSGKEWQDGYLARGEVYGSSFPFWRSRSINLKGIGFHFDGTNGLKEGDLLVTSGLDGVFPPNLRVGNVLKVEPMKEGGYAYDIEVRPSVHNLNDLQTVFILPAMGE